jgi:hypothetical protein
VVKNIKNAVYYIPDKTMKKPNYTPVPVTIDLVLAHPEDLKELDRYENLPDGSTKKVMKLKRDLPFWLKSIQTGKIEPVPYRLDENHDPHEIAAWLKQEMIYIAKRILNSTTKELAN